MKNLSFHFEFQQVTLGTRLDANIMASRSISKRESDISWMSITTPTGIMLNCFTCDTNTDFQISRYTKKIFFNSNIYEIKFNFNELVTLVKILML